MTYWCVYLLLLAEGYLITAEFGEVIGVLTFVYRIVEILFENRLNLVVLLKTEKNVCSSLSF